ncbi:MAG: hypothetical protein ACHQE5_08625 [Actinomycetes bacterium]
MDERAAPPQEVRSDAPLVVHDPAVLDDPDRRTDLFDPRISHKIHLLDRGPFAVAVCSGCGWESFARRSRPLARREGRDHELLFGAGGG